MTWYIAPVGTPEPLHHVEHGRFSQPWPNTWTMLPDDSQVKITEQYRDTWFISPLAVYTHLYSFAIGWESFDNKLRLLFRTASQYDRKTVLAVGSFSRYDAGGIRLTGVSVDAYFSKQGCLR